MPDAVRPPAVVAVVPRVVDSADVDDVTVTTADNRMSLSRPATTPHPPSLPKHHDGAPTWLHYTTFPRAWFRLGNRQAEARGLSVAFRTLAGNTGRGVGGGALATGVRLTWGSLCDVANSDFILLTKELSSPPTSHWRGDEGKFTRLSRHPPSNTNSRSSLRQGVSSSPPQY